ncbi:MAG: DUF2339 domain-containing protein [Planctomycetota bacterium]|nr:MAG: DUF2339 domain-containing protein [Planctomycetota bacterium]
MELLYFFFFCTGGWFLLAPIWILARLKEIQSEVENSKKSFGKVLGQVASLRASVEKAVAFIPKPEPVLKPEAQPEPVFVPQGVPSAESGPAVEPMLEKSGLESAHLGTPVAAPVPLVPAPSSHSSLLADSFEELEWQRVDQAKAAPARPLNIPPVPVAPARPWNIPLVPVTPARHQTSAASPDQATRGAQVSPLESAANETLHKIGNWILFGSEKLAPGVSLEFAVASQWLLRIGVAILVLGLGFFVKYSLDNDLISQEARVLATAAAGLVLLVGGTRLLGGKYGILGQGLMGGGITTLYFSIYAACVFYGLIPLAFAFTLMAVVTALSGFIAVRFASILVAVLGVLGGYLTPLLIKSVEADLTLLHGYMFILAAGVLCTCVWRKWPLVNMLAFICHYLLFQKGIYAGSADCHERALPFLGMYFLLFSTMPFLYNLRNRQSSGLLELAGLYINAGVCFLLGWHMLYTIGRGENWPALLSLSLAFFYGAHAMVFLRLRIVDRPMVISFLALSAIFLALTMPLYLSTAWLTTAWALQAVAMAWMARQLGSGFLRQLAYLIMVMVFGRFVLVDLPYRTRMADTSPDTPVWVFLSALAIRLVEFGTPILALMASGWLLGKAEGDRQHLMLRENDLEDPADRATVLRLSVITGVVIALAYLGIELSQTMLRFSPDFHLASLTFLGALFTLLVLLRGAFWIGQPAVVAISFFLALALGFKLLMVDLGSVAGKLSDPFLYNQGWALRGAVSRVFDLVIVVGTFAFMGRILSGQGVAKAWPIFSTAGIVLTLILSTLEACNILEYAQMGSFRPGAISILWTLFGLGLLLFGVRMHERWVRYGGLALFLIVTLKVFLSDLKGVETLYKVAAFMVLGVLLLAGSFIYLKYQPSIDTDQKNPGKGTT